MYSKKVPRICLNNYVKKNTKTLFYYSPATKPALTSTECSRTIFNIANAMHT